MKLSEAVKKRIINLTNEKNITLHRLSLNSGISYSTLNSFINGKAKVLKLQPYYIYVKD